MDKQLRDIELHLKSIQATMCFCTAVLCFCFNNNTGIGFGFGMIWAWWSNIQDLRKHINLKKQEARDEQG